MTRDDIIKLAREAGCLGPDKGGDPYGLWEPHGSENVTELMFRFAALVAAAEREKVAAWMMQRSYATGHGDTIEDLIKELEWQVAEREREECAQLCETKHFSSPIREAGAKICAAAIRARGQS